MKGDKEDKIRGGHEEEEKENEDEEDSIPARKTDVTQ
jgi:hypothetical protein